MTEEHVNFLARNSVPKAMTLEEVEAATQSGRNPERCQSRAFFNYITTGAFTPVGPLLAPVVKQDFQMNWALLI